MLHSLDSQDFFFEAVVTVNMSALLVLATMFIGSKIKNLGNLITLCLYSQSDLADHVLCEDDWDLVDLQPLHPLHGGAPSYLHGFPQVRCSKSFFVDGWRIFSYIVFNYLKNDEERGAFLAYDDDDLLTGWMREPRTSRGRGTSRRSWWSPPWTKIWSLETKKCKFR